MPWETKKPDLKNNPTYLEPRVADVEAKTKANAEQLADIVTLQNLKNINQDPNFDNATLINSAIQNANQRTKIILPQGTFKIKTTILVNKPFVTIEGQGEYSTILQYDGLDVALHMDGTSSPAYRSYQKLKNLTISSTQNRLGGVGLRTTLNANFHIGNVKIENFEINYSCEGSLIADFKNVHFDYGKKGLVFKQYYNQAQNFYMPCNMLNFDTCLFTSNTEQAISAKEPVNGLKFNICEIENNGMPNSGINIIEFIGFNSDSIPAPIVFDACWFEENKGLHEIFINPYDRNGSVVLVGNTFITNDVDTNLYMTKGNITSISNDFKRITKVKQVFLGADTLGFFSPSQSNIPATFEIVSNDVVIYGSDGGLLTNLKLKKDIHMLVGTDGIHKIVNNQTDGTLDIEGHLGLNLNKKVTLTEGATFGLTTTPTAGTSLLKLYVNSTDGVLYFRDWFGNDHPLITL